MKISNSKKQLAKIIHENGGWCDGAEFAAQDRDGKVCYYSSKPSIGKCCEAWGLVGCLIACEYRGKALPNWHQTILSRKEYSHLYPAPDAKPEFCESVMRSIPEPSDNPTIEQLAADYRNLLDFAKRKQEEADDAKADAEAKLAELVAAGKVLGLVLSVAPVQKYTGKFYNAELGEAPAYGKDTRDAVCDGCGKRYGAHYGNHCKSDSEE